jgi:2-desacetyl-2-hydroxyethyl bacteriochlorophyllide A dehydrogenase
MPQAAVYEGQQRFSIRPSPVVRPGPGKVRLSIAWAGICGTDRHIYRGHMDARVKPPQVPGHEMAGTIAELGPDVSGWHVGQKVVVRPIISCGQCPACRAGHAHVCHRINVLGVDSPGVFQGSLVVPAGILHRLPDGIDLRRAALVEPLAVACHDVRLGEVREGQLVVVLGGGPIGLLIALVARQRGATAILAEINPTRSAIANQTGIATVDPTSEDLPALIDGRTDGAGADVVFEVSAAEPSAALMARLVRVRGTVVQVGIFHKPVAVDLNRIFLREIVVRGARLYEPEDFEAAIGLIDRLPVDKLISAQHPLADVGRAFVALDQRSDLMKVLLECGQP